MLTYTEYVNDSFAINNSRIFFYFVLFFIREERKALLTNERFKHLDETEIASTRAEKECFLHLAVR